MFTKNFVFFSAFEKTFPDDPPCDLLIIDRWRSPTIIERVTLSPSPKGHQQNCQVPVFFLQKRKLGGGFKDFDFYPPTLGFHDTNLTWRISFSNGWRKLPPTRKPLGPSDPLNVAVTVAVDIQDFLTVLRKQGVFRRVGELGGFFF